MPGCTRRANTTWPASPSAVEKSKILTGQDVKPGDVVPGLFSSACTPTASLVRKCIERATRSAPCRAPTLDGQPFRQAIMAPTRQAVKNVLARARQAPDQSCRAHRRRAACSRTSRACCSKAPPPTWSRGSWPQTELFAWLRATAGIDDIRDEPHLPQRHRHGRHRGRRQTPTAATLRESSASRFTRSARSPNRRGRQGRRGPEPPAKPQKKATMGLFAGFDARSEQLDRHGGDGGAGLAHGSRRRLVPAAAVLGVEEARPVAICLR